MDSEDDENLSRLERVIHNMLDILRLDLPVHVCMASKNAVRNSACEGGAYALVDTRMRIITWGKSNENLKAQTLYRIVDYRNARYVIHVDSAHMIDALALKRLLERTAEMQYDRLLLEDMMEALRVKDAKDAKDILRPGLRRR